jgi:hypothetical protein
MYILALLACVFVHMAAMLCHARGLGKGRGMAFAYGVSNIHVVGVQRANGFLCFCVTKFNSLATARSAACFTVVH